jgi:hypothetical protein
VSDVSVVQASITADAAPFLAALKASSAASQALIGTMGDMTAGARAAAESVGSSWVNVSLSFREVSKIAKELVSVIGDAVDAANAVDPAGAKVWAKDVADVQAAFKGVAAEVGQSVRPALESAMETATKAIKYLGGLDWSRMWKDFSDATKQLRDDLASTLAWMGSGIHDAMVSVANFLTWPWQQLQTVIASSLAFALETAGSIASKIGAVMEAVGHKNGLGAMGSNLTNAGAAARNANANLAPIGQQMVDGAIDIGKSIAKGISGGAGDVLKNAKDFYDSYQTGKALPKVPSGGAGPGVDKEALAAWAMAVKVNADLQAQSDQMHVQAAQEAMRVQVSGAKEAAEQAHSGFEAASKVLAEAYKDGGAEQIASAGQAAAVALAAEQEKGQAYIAAMQAAEQQAASIASDAQAARNAAQQAFNDAQIVNAMGASAYTAKALGDAAKKLEDATRAVGDAQKRADDAHDATGHGTAGVMKQSDKDAAQAAQEAAAAHKKAVEGVGIAARGQLGGSAGPVSDAIVAGVKNADPMAALATAAIQIVGKSKGFQDLLTALNTLIDSVGSALGQLFEGLAPLVQLIGSSVAPLITSLGDVLLQVGEAATAIVAPLLQGMAPLMGALGQLLSALGPLVPMFVQFGMLVSGEGPAMMVLAEAMKLLAPAVELLAQGTKVVVDAIADAWNWIVQEISDLLKSLDGIPLLGSVMDDAAADVLAMKVQINAVTPAAEGAAAALTQLQSAGTDITSAFGVMRNVLADANARNLAGVETQAYGGLGAHDAGSGDLFNIAFAKGMNDQVLEPLIAMMNQVQSQLTSATSSDDSARAKVVMDDATVQALQQAMAQASDPATRAALQKQLDATEASKVLDADAMRLADAQLAVQQDQLQVAKDALQMQILQLEYDEAGREGNAAAQSSLLNAMMAVGQDQAAAYGSQSNDAATVQSAMVQQALDQARASTTNTTSTDANTKATRDLTTSLTNMVSGFNVARYNYEAAMGDAGTVAGGTSGGGVSPRKPAEPSKSAGGTHFHGPITIQVDSKDPDQFAKRVVKALQTHNMRTTGTIFGGQF